MSKVHTLPKTPAPAKAKVTKVVQMAHVRSTPGTHVYGTEADGVACKQVYLTKVALGETAPKSITLTIEFDAA
mgnify:CR=1 FL=1